MVPATWGSVLRAMRAARTAADAASAAAANVEATLAALAAFADFVAELNRLQDTWWTWLHADHGCDRVVLTPNLHRLLDLAGWIDVLHALRQHALFSRVEQILHQLHRRAIVCFAHQRVYVIGACRDDAELWTVARYATSPAPRPRRIEIARRPRPRLYTDALTGVPTGALDTPLTLVRTRERVVMRDWRPMRQRPFQTFRVLADQRDAGGRRVLVCTPHGTSTKVSLALLLAERALALASADAPPPDVPLRKKMAEAFGAHTGGLTRFDACFQRACAPSDEAPLPTCQQDPSLPGLAVQLAAAGAREGRWSLCVVTVPPDPWDAPLQRFFHSLAHCEMDPIVHTILRYVGYFRESARLYTRLLWARGTVVLRAIDGGRH